MEKISGRRNGAQPLELLGIEPRPARSKTLALPTNPSPGKITKKLMVISDEVSKLTDELMPNKSPGPRLKP